MTRDNATPVPPAPQPEAIRTLVRPLAVDELRLAGGGRLMRIELENVLVSSYSVSGHG